MFWYALTIFLSSFLLFQVQPIIAKMILPWFGGTAAVWNTCMLFFQLTLLGGYAYAHFVFERTSAKRQTLIHISLLFGALLLLPIIPGAEWKPEGAEEPIVLILGLLTATIGLPYFILSTTGPLLQAWYAKEFQGVMPYRLFALSNVASLLALVTYPLLVEPYLSVNTQAWIWSGFFVVFVGLCAFLAWRSRQFPVLPNSELISEPGPSPKFLTKVLWTFLATVPSILLLTVTAHLTQDIAAIPFLWILPLILYLLTFILCFESSRFYWRWPYVILSVLGLSVVLWAANLSIGQLGLVREIVLFSSALFVCSMVCHGELALTKPHPRYLTQFYLCVSIGGALGGVFVGLVAPMIFETYAEFPIGWWCTGLCILIALLSHYWSDLSHSARWISSLTGCALLAVYGSSWVIYMQESTQVYDQVSRNFYGRISIANGGEGQYRYRKMFHGGINHGHQFVDDKFRREPVSYYCVESGIGQLFSARSNMEPQTVGIIGLGTGTLAAYGRHGDQFHLFDINPKVVELAQSHFTFLSDSAAEIHLHLGDARLVLESLEVLHYDILVVDAFSSDAVPVHLITREAYELYLSRLKPGGVIALHISNRYLSLGPVLAANAEATGLESRFAKHVVDHEDGACFDTDWVLHHRTGDPMAASSLASIGEVLEPRADFRMWTDQFSNLWSILK